MEKHQIKTRFLTLVLLCSLVFAWGTLAFAQTLYYEEKVVQPVARGVNYESSWRFTSLGWLKMHVLKVDLKEPSLRIEPIFNQKGVGTPLTLAQLAGESGAVAAINGDFFYSQGSYMVPVGPINKGGKLVASPGNNADMAVFAINQDRGVEILPWQGKGTVTLSEHQSFSLAGVNKPGTDYAWPILYTREWGSHSPDTPAGVVTVIGVGNQAIKATEEGRQDIPPGGFALVGGGEAAQDLRHLSAGDRLEVTYTTTPPWQKYVAAIGGGGRLLQGGKVVEGGHEVAGSHPRTAVGVSADGQTLYLVVVDGRQDASRGLEQAELARLMLELGAAEALNLDGGNSSTLVARAPGEGELAVKNCISGSALRPVPNGIGVFTAIPPGAASGLVLRVSDENIPLEGSRRLSLTAYDANYNPVPLPQGEAKWEVYPRELGRVVEGVFIPEASGRGEIRVEMTGGLAQPLRGQVEIRVLKPAEGLSLSTGELNLEVGAKSKLGAVVTDSAGYRGTIDGGDLCWEIQGGDIGTIQDGEFIAGPKAAAGVIIARLGEIEAGTVVTVGREALLLSRLDTMEGLSFLSWPQGIGGGLMVVDPPEQLPGREGKVVQLAYDFTPREKTTRAAYLVLNGGRVLHPHGQSLGLWVYGDESGHWLRAMLTDAAGEQFPLDLARRVDWQGWRYVRAALPTDKKLPLALQRLYLTEPDSGGGGTGRIYLGDIQVELPLTQPTDLLPKAPNAVDPALMAEGQPIPAGAKLLIVGNIAPNIDQEKFSQSLAAEKAKSGAEQLVTTGPIAGIKGVPPLSSTDQPVMLSFRGVDLTFLKTGEGGLRSSDGKQWPWLLNKLESGWAETAFYFLDRAPFKGELPGVVGFSNKAEAELLRGLLSKKAAEGKGEVWVMSGGVAPGDELRWVLSDGVRYLSLPAVSDPANFSYIVITLGPNGLVYSQHRAGK